MKYKYLKRKFYCEKNCGVQRRDWNFTLQKRW